MRMQYILVVVGLIFSLSEQTSGNHGRVPTPQLPMDDPLIRRDSKTAGPYTPEQV